MIIIMNRLAPEEQVQAVIAQIRQAGLSEHISKGAERTIIGAVGDERSLTVERFESMPGVERAMRVVREYRIVSREIQPDNTVVQVRGVPFGGEALQIIAGPAAVESESQITQATQLVKASGCRVFHGGVFQQHASPYGFQGLGVAGLAYLQQAAQAQGLPVVSELADISQLEVFLEQAVDVVLIGTRSMHNTELLKAIGRLNKPVILQRAMAASVSEWLMAAEYIAAGGNHNIIFCEGGGRSMVDMAAIPALKRETHLPVIVAPSHAGGKAWQVPALAKAAIAAGADGLLLDVHPEPANALCDADQALAPEVFDQLLAELRVLAPAVGRTLH